jgi:hypothetical protein
MRDKIEFSSDGNQVVMELQDLHTIGPHCFEKSRHIVAGKLECLMKGVEYTPVTIGGNPEAKTMIVESNAWGELFRDWVKNKRRRIGAKTRREIRKALDQVNAATVKHHQRSVAELPLHESHWAYQCLVSLRTC